MTKTFSFLFLALLLPMVTWANESPNVVIIYTDDHGYTDLGVYGIDPHVRTSQMDALATGGIIMTSGYCSAPQCRPSRAGLMTGRIQNRFGLRTNGTKKLPLAEKTIAQRIKEARPDYRTGFVGKWHLDPKTADQQDPESYPGTREDYLPGGKGFDDYWEGSVAPFNANYNLKGESIDPQMVRDNRNRVLVQGEAAVAYIEKNKEEPFFLYLALFGPHIPRIRTDDPYYQDFPEVDYPQFNDAENKIRRQGLALIKAIDDAVGAVRAKLEKAGLLENTLILFVTVHEPV